MNRLRIRHLFRKYKYLSLAIMLVSFMAFTLFIVLPSLTSSLKLSLDSYLKNYGYPDAVITIESTEINRVENLKELDCVSDFNSRFRFASVMSRLGKPSPIKCFTFDYGDFGKFHYWEKSTKKTIRPEVLIEYNFAKKNQIKAGETVDISLGKEEVRFFVRAVVSCPEVLEYRNADEWGSGAEYGVLYFNRSLFDSGKNFNFCNQLLLKFKDNPEVSLKKVSDFLEKNGVKIIESYTYKESPLKTRIDNNLQPFDILCKLVPAIFFVITLVVVYFTVSVLVRMQEKEIGILMSLGFEKKEIVRWFCRYIIALALIAIVLSIPLALWILRNFGEVYKNFFPLPEINCSFDNKYVISGVFAVLFTDLIAGLIGCRRILKLTPVQAIDNSKNLSSEIVSPLFSKIGSTDPLVKFVLSTMFRNKKRFAFIILCIAVVVSFLFTTLSYQVSNDYLVEELFEERINYDAMAVFDAEPHELVIQWLFDHNMISDYEKALYFNRNINGEKAVIIATESGSSMISPAKNVVVPETGIVLESQLAKRLGIEIGDLVKIGDSQVAVTSLANQGTSKMQFVSMAQAEALGESDGFALLCNIKDRKSFEEYLGRLPGLLNVMITQDEKNNAIDIFNNYNLPVKMVLAFSIAIGILTTSLTAGISFMERSRETSVILSQGFLIRDLLKGWLLCSAIQLVLGCAIGFPFACMLSKYILSVFSIARRTYYFVSSFREVALTLCFISVCVLLGNVASLAVIRRWNIADKIKDSQ